MYSDFIFSYGRYLDAAWSSRTGLSARRIDRDTRFRWLARFESRQFARMRERRTPRQRGICSLTTGGVSIITILDGNKSPCHRARRGNLRAQSGARTRSTTLARYRACLEKSSPTGLSIRCLSREQHGKPAFDRKP